MTLADLAPGESARLIDIDTRDPGVIRLMILGMVEDITVRMENIAIGGDQVVIMAGPCSAESYEQTRAAAAAAAPFCSATHLA